MWYDPFWVSKLKPIGEKWRGYSCISSLWREKKYDKVNWDPFTRPIHHKHQNLSYLNTGSGCSHSVCEFLSLFVGVFVLEFWFACMYMWFIVGVFVYLFACVFVLFHELVFCVLVTVCLCDCVFCYVFMCFAFVLVIEYHLHCSRCQNYCKIWHKTTQTFLPEPTTWLLKTCHIITAGSVTTGK